MERPNDNVSRLNNSITNVATGGALQFLTLLLNFVVRIVFVRVIGYSYLGISSLFTNILTVLSVADLGFGTSISISLYSALKKADEKHISAIIAYYRRVYFVIGAIVFMAGLMIRPFVSYVVNTETAVPNLELYFFVYLVNLVSTYFISYRHAIIKADQKNGVINTIQSFVLLGKSLIELVVIMVIPRVANVQAAYITYLIVMVLATYVSEIWCARLAKKMYPYAFQGGQIPQEEKKEISKNVKSLLLYKVCNAVNKSIDSILISILVSTTILGKYSNYTLIIGVLMGFGCLVSRNSIASLGNYVLTETKEKQADMFYMISFVHIAIAAFFIVNYVGILQPFFHFIFGLDSTLSIAALVLTAIHIGFDLNYQVNELFRETTKMFRKIPYISAINLVLNIILSIVLGHFFGLEGIIAGTLIAYFLTSFWFETFALFKYHLQMSSKKVWFKLAYAVIVIAIFATGAFLITNNVKIDDQLYKLAFSTGVSLVLSVGCVLSFAWFKEFKKVFTIAKQAFFSVCKSINAFLNNKKLQLIVLIGSAVMLVVCVVARDLLDFEINKLVFVGLIFVSALMLRGEYFIAYILFTLPFHSGLPTGYIYILLAGLFLIKNITLFKKWQLIPIYLFIPTLVFVWELVMSSIYGKMTSVTDALQVFSVLLFSSFLIYDRKSTSKRPLFVFAISVAIVGLIILINWFKIIDFIVNHDTNKTFKSMLELFRFGDTGELIDWYNLWYLPKYPYKASMFLGDNQNYLGFLCLSGIMAASFVLFKERGAIYRKPVCFLIIVLLTGLGFFTGSKSFFFCFAIFVVLFILSLIVERTIKWWAGLLILAAIGGGVYLLCTKNEFVNHFIIQRLDSDSQRISLIKDYFDFIFSDQDVMLFGTGASRLQEMAMYDQPPHNALAQIMGGYGVIGTGVIVIGLGYTLFGSKLFKGKCLAAFIPTLVFVIFSMTSQIFIPPNTLVYGLPVLYILAMNSNANREELKAKEQAI